MLHVRSNAPMSKIPALSLVGLRSWITRAEVATLLPRRLAFLLLEPGREGRILCSRRVPPSLVWIAKVLSSTPHNGVVPAFSVLLKSTQSFSRIC